MCCLDSFSFFSCLDCLKNDKNNNAKTGNDDDESSKLKSYETVLGECTICFYEKTLIVLECKHELCETCLTTWETKSSICPTCKQPMIY